MCFIERKTHNFFLKFREIFPCRETVFRVHGMKSDKKPFFFQIYAIFWRNNGACCDWQVFFFISEGFYDFLYPRLSLIVPLNTWNLSLNIKVSPGLKFDENHQILIRILVTFSFKDQFLTLNHAVSVATIINFGFWKKKWAPGIISHTKRSARRIGDKSFSVHGPSLWN